MKRWSWDIYSIFYFTIIIIFPLYWVRRWSFWKAAISKRSQFEKWKNKFIEKQNKILSIWMKQHKLWWSSLYHLLPPSINERKEQVIKYDIQFHGDGDDDADVGTCDNMWDPVVGVVSTSRVCVTHSTLQHLTCQRVPKVDINRKLFPWAFEFEA